jgi:hypothetical protein
MLRLDTATHTYFYRRADGTETQLDSVSQTLKRVGLIDDRWYTPDACSRGSHVHLACELLDRGELDEDDLDPQLIPFLDGYRKFLFENDPRYTGIELPVVHLEDEYAGTLDRCGVLRAGKYEGAVFVGDIKSGAKSYWHKWQLAAYVKAWTGTEADTLRIIIRLTKAGNYILDPYEDRKDFRVWAAICAVAREQRVNKVPNRYAA